MAKKLDLTMRMDDVGYFSVFVETENLWPEEVAQNVGDRIANALGVEFIGFRIKNTDHD